MSEEIANQLKIRVRLGVEPQHTLPFIKKIKIFLNILSMEIKSLELKRKGELSYQKTSD